MGDKVNISLSLKVLIVMLMMLYIYHISFALFPYALRTRVLIAIVGVAVVVANAKATVNLDIARVVSWIVAAILPIVFTMLINSYIDLWFIQNLFLTLIFLIGAYAVIKVIQYLYGNSFNIAILFQYIVYGVCAHNLISMLGFMNPSVGSFLSIIQNQDDGASNTITQIIEFKSRIIGLGIGTFFTGGITSSLGLICCSYLLLSSPRQTNTLIYSLTFIFILISGMFIARTTLIGAIYSLFYILTPRIFLKNAQDYGNRYLVRNRNFFFGICIIISIISITFFSFKALQYNSAFNHAFEMFLNFGSNKSLNTSSTDAMADMFVFPKTVKTWTIGDGRFSDGASYYMKTDIGYLRLIYYYGLIGLLFYIGQQLMVIKIIIKRANDFEEKFLYSIFLLFILTVNFKGIGDISYFIYLFLWYYILVRKPSISE